MNDKGNSLFIRPFFTSILKLRPVQQSGSITMSKLQEKGGFLLSLFFQLSDLRHLKNRIGFFFQIHFKFNRKCHRSVLSP